jgi:hypothetical protein
LYHLLPQKNILAGRIKNPFDNRKPLLDKIQAIFCSQNCLYLKTMPFIALQSPYLTPAQPTRYSVVDEIKYRRYNLCLLHVQTIIADFFPAAGSSRLKHLFHTLGNVACCIDTHLDDLDISQKEKLLREFPDFFDSLPENGNEDLFSMHLSSLCRSLGTVLYPPEAAYMLSRFYRYCSELGVLAELKEFSIAVIKAGVKKSQARSGKEILHCLAMEGSAAIHFLLLVLQKERVVVCRDKKFYRLQRYLHRLERMLNIADDIGDSRKDKAKGLIELNIGFTYYFFLCSRLLKTFSATLLFHHFLFLRHFALFTRRYLFQG